MYRLYPIDENLTTIKSFLIDYEWDMDGNNHEWRNCISHFLELLQSYGSKVSPIDVPPFIGHEDFLVLAYAVDDVRVEFSSDSLLNLIEVSLAANSNFGSLWLKAGTQIGWTAMSPKVIPEDDSKGITRIFKKIFVWLSERHIFLLMAAYVVYELLQII